MGIIEEILGNIRAVILALQLKRHNRKYNIHFRLWKFKEIQTTHNIYNCKKCAVLLSQMMLSNIADFSIPSYIILDP